MNRLRPEFISQTTELREYLFNFSKPKKMHNREISGSVLAGLALQYVKAINGGAVPNIENAWTYVCSAQKDKLKQELLIEFEKQIEEEIESKLPMENKDLESILKQIKKTCKENFEKNSLDKVSNEEKNEFKRELIKLENKIKNENQILLEEMIQTHLINEFNTQIKKKLEEFNKKKPKMSSNSANYIDIEEEEEKNKIWLEEEIKSWKILQNNFKMFISSNKDKFINKNDLFYKFLYE